MRNKKLKKLKALRQLDIIIKLFFIDYSYVIIILSTYYLKKQTDEWFKIQKNIGFVSKSGKNDKNRNQKTNKLTKF